MAISAEQLNVILSARDREFTRAMDRAQRRVQSFSRNSSRSLGRTSQAWSALASSARAFLPALSAGVLISNVRRVVSELDEIGKTADRLGLTTDALQELRVAAESAGVSANTLDMAMQRFGRRLAEARQGAGEARGALEEMGIALFDADGSARDIESVLGDVANAMQDMTDQTDRNRIAMRLFDSEGVALVNMLRDGADGLDNMRREARELGIVIDEDLIRNAEDAENQLALMSRVINANLSQALINLAPLLVSAAEGIAGLTSSARGFMETLREIETQGDLSVIVSDMETIQRLIDDFENGDPDALARLLPLGGIDAARERLASLQAQYEELSGTVSDAPAQPEPVEVATGGADLSAMEAAVEAERERARLAALTAEERERARIEAEAEALVQEAMAQRQGDLMLPANIEAAIAAAELRDEYIAAATAASSILNPVEELERGTSRVSENLGEVPPTLDEIIQGMIDANPALEALGFNAENLQGVMQTVESSMESAFMSMVDGTKSAEDAFKDMARQIIMELYRVLVVQRLVGSFTSGGGGILGAAFGAFGGATGAASGRPVQPGRPYEVGEHGRELFVPQTAGRVLSVAQAQNAVGGGGSVVVNQTINVSTGVQQTVRTEIKSMMPQIAESAKNAVVDAKLRGGSYGRAF